MVLRRTLEGFHEALSSPGRHGCGGHLPELAMRVEPVLNIDGPEITFLSP